MKRLNFMARVTVEDCLDKISSRFELIVWASKRARDLDLKPDQARVDWDNDKSTVVALREISDEKFSLEELKTKIK